MIREIPVRNVPSLGGKFAFSPGRRFFATWNVWKRSLDVYDLTTGAEAGRLAPAETGAGGDSLNVEEVAFSPDGTRIAFAMNSSRESAVRTYDAATGEAADDAPLPYSLYDLVAPSGGDAPALEWTPDGRGVVMRGAALLDPRTGRVLWRLALLPNMSSIGIPLYQRERRRATPWGVAALRGNDRAATLDLLRFPKPEDVPQAGAEAGSARLSPGGRSRSRSRPPA